jgi:hypothetical protein
MIEVSLRLLPPDPRWLDFAGFVAPVPDAGDEFAPEAGSDGQSEDEPAGVSRPRELVGSAADR